MEDRDLMDLEANRKKLTAFIRAAREGKYYRPMEAVSRIATITAASESLGEDSLLRALAQEIAARRTAVSTVGVPQYSWRSKVKIVTVRNFLRDKKMRSRLFTSFAAQGGSPGTWARVLQAHVPAEAQAEMQGWTEEQWIAFVGRRVAELGPSEPPAPAKAPFSIDEETIERVRTELPQQPWPVGVHHEVALRLEMNPNVVWEYIGELIRRGVFHPQGAQESPQNVEEAG